MPPPPPLFTTSCEKMFSHTADRMTVTGCLPLLYTHTPHYIVHISFLRVPLLTFFILDSQKQCSASDGYFAGLKKKKERLPGLYVPWCQLIKGSLHPTEALETPTARCPPPGMLLCFSITLPILPLFLAPPSGSYQRPQRGVIAHFGNTVLNEFVS